MKLVDGNGVIRSLPGDIDSTSVSPEDVMKAAQTNLGLYGVILEFTVKVQPMSNCEVNNVFNLKMEDVIPRKTLRENFGARTHTEKLAKLLNKYWSVELFWFPFNSIINRMLQVLPDMDDTELTVSTASFFASHPIDSLQHVKEVLKTHNLLPLIWCPWDDHLWIRGINIDRDRKKEVTQEPGIPFWSRLVDFAQHTGGEYFLAPMMKNLPDTTPLSVMIGYQLVKMQYGTFQQDEVVRTPWAIHYRDAIDKMTVYDIEFAFPTDINHPLTVVKAIRKVIDIVEKYAFEGKFPTKDQTSDDHKGTKGKKIHFPLSLCMEMRVMQKSESLLCPASIGDETHITYIEVLSTTGTRGYEQFFTEVAMEWIKLGGIPHWHKQWEFLQESFDIFSYLRNKYGKNMETFMKVHEALKVDPDGIFMNDTMKKLFLNQ
jgi:hypothetical protein